MEKNVLYLTDIPEEIKLIEAAEERISALPERAELLVEFLRDKRLWSEDGGLYSRRVGRCRKDHDVSQGLSEDAIVAYYPHEGFHACSMREIR